MQGCRLSGPICKYGGIEVPQGGRIIAYPFAPYLRGMPPSRVLMRHVLQPVRRAGTGTAFSVCHMSL